MYSCAGNTFSCRIERQHTFEQALVKRSRVTTWQVGAPGSSDKQRVAGEHAVFDAQAHGIACMAGRMDGLQSQPPDHEQFTTLQTQIRRMVPDLRYA